MSYSYEHNDYSDERDYKNIKLPEEPSDNFDEVNAVDEVLDNLRTYAWNKGLNIFMSDKYKDNLSELLPQNK